MAVWQGIPYTFTGPDGTIAVFNDRADPNFVGYLTEPPTGLDGPPIRERAYDLVDSDGGRHGEFLASRRPVAFQGLILPSGVQATDEDRQNRLLAATWALGPGHQNANNLGDTVISWTESLRGAVQLFARTQQPTRITGRRPKIATVSMVSADHRIVSQTLLTTTVPAIATGSTTDFTVATGGKAPADFVFSLGNGAAGTVLTAFTLYAYRDAARTDLVSRTAVDLGAAGISQPAGVGQYVQLYQGRTVGNPGIAVPQVWSNVNGAEDAGLVYHPLNWQPLPAGTAYMRLAVTFTGAGPLTGLLDRRASWAQ